MKYTGNYDTITRIVILGERFKEVKWLDMKDEGRGTFRVAGWAERNYPAAVRLGKNLKVEGCE
jgi:hypothetical protein